ncbi:MAG: hypothetical protein OXR68_02290 [Alphaproteobacteria bacterium]|nr:hypothetical protein [Alphaproteobacteria bacterium]MDD9919438.1 hypothetical protein [Alphaproteobacteria bacterium]
MTEYQMPTTVGAFFGDEGRKQSLLVALNEGKGLFWGISPDQTVGRAQPILGSGSIQRVTNLPIVLIDLIRDMVACDLFSEQFRKDFEKSSLEALIPGKDYSSVYEELVIKWLTACAKEMRLLPDDPICQVVTWMTDKVSRKSCQFDVLYQIAKEAGISSIIQTGLVEAPKTFDEVLFAEKPESLPYLAATLASFGISPVLPIWHRMVIQQREVHDSLEDCRSVALSAIVDDILSALRGEEEIIVADGLVHTIAGDLEEALKKGN